MIRSATILVMVCLATSAFGAIKSINRDLVPAADGDFVFVVAGDNRPTTHGAPFPHVLDTLLSEVRLIQPDLVLWTGDTVYGYGDKDRTELANEYSLFMCKAAQADVPIFNAPGNHEIHPKVTPCDQPGVCEAEFVSHFGGPYGSFDHRGVHFIALDTEEIGHTKPITVDGKQMDAQVIEGDQLTWLQNDLEAHKGARAIFAFFHTELTPAPNDEEGKTHPPLGNAAEIRALFAKYHVKAVFQGHEHLLYVPDPKTTDGVRYFVAGGAGAPMYARPENGGVSNYIVVKVKGSDATFDIVEPGRFYAEGANDVVWLINSNDIDLPAKRIEAKVPASVGACDSLVFDQTLAKNFKGAIHLETCKPWGGSVELTLSTTEDMPKRSSMDIHVHAKK
jgi:hypothetical protein